MTFNLENPFRKAETRAKKRLFANGNQVKEPSLKVKEKVARVAREMKKPYGEFKILPKQIEFLHALEKIITKYAKISQEEAQESILQGISEVDQQGNIIAANLSKCLINKVPPEIAGLINLKILNFGHNDIKELPAELFSLENLEELNIENNELDLIPEEIGQLKNLKVLNLHWNNGLKNLPESLGDLKELRELDCNCGKLGKLPDSISNLTKLEKLAVGAALDRNSSERARIKQLFPFVNL
jgi:hypothetical protein